MATTNTTTEAGELIASFQKLLSKGYCIPKEYNTLTGIKENIPAIVQAVQTAFAYTIIRLILTGDYPQLKNLKKDGDCAIDNVKVVIATFTNNKDEDVLFVTKDKMGQLVWLEKGNKSAGLEHILYGDGRSRGHASDFKKALGLESSQLSGYLQKVITYGSIVSNTIKPVGNIMGFEKVYSYEGNYYIVIGIGTNGFILSAYPRKKGGK